MTFVNNVKRRLRSSCVIVVFSAMCFLLGCSSPKLTTRIYPLGRHPKAAEKAINEIVCDEVIKHIDAEQKRPSRILMSKPLDGQIVVKTTSEGHRQIEVSLKRLEEQSTIPEED